MLFAASIIFFLIEVNEVQFTAALSPNIHVKPDFNISLVSHLFVKISITSKTYI